MITNYIEDLNLKKDILPIFDNTLNYLAKEKLYYLLDKPLKSFKEIEKRQNIIKGFILNNEIIKEYNYSKIHFHDVYNFLMNLETQDLATSKIVLYISKNIKSLYSSKLIQVINIFSKIEIILSKINQNDFSPEFSKEINYILNFISELNITNYDKRNLTINDISILAKSINNKKNEFNTYFEKLIQIEVYISLACSIKQKKLNFPTFSKNSITFDSLYHPLLNSPVTNNVKFIKNVIILTGPNMSGKSTFLKSIFINIYLGHLGLAVSAKKASFPFFNYFSISINSNDNIKKGYSHFLNEIKILKNVLLESNDGKTCFAIFDELFKGTNIDDAFQISSQTIKGLLNHKKSYFIISTHIQTLNQINEIKDNLTENYYIEAKIEENKPIFTYKLKEGWTNLKIGKILFENEGINLLLSNKNS